MNYVLFTLSIHKLINSLCSLPSPSSYLNSMPFNNKNKGNRIKGGREGPVIPFARLFGSLVRANH